MRRIGALMGVAERDPEGKAWVSVFRTALQQSGRIEGRNLQIDFRWSAADIAVMATHAEELVELKPDVILSHASPATAAIRKATRAIPNVFAVVADPVGSGFVESFSRPGGNSTGFTNFEQTIGSKWLELLKELAPQISRVAMLFNPVTLPGGNNSIYARTIKAATASFKVSAIRSPFRDADDMKNVFAAFEREPTGLIVFPDTSTTVHSRLIAELAAEHRIPAIYPYRDFVEVGGLLSYGVDRVGLYRRAASYIDRILRGDKPADLPVQNPVKYEMALNVQAAKALGLTIPVTFLLRADKVIE